ncbi:MAG: response regulator [Polyangiaceae bacterium]
MSRLHPKWYNPPIGMLRSSTSVLERLRALIEAALAVPGRRLPSRAIIEEALQEAGPGFDVDDRGQMPLFVHGPLANAVEHHLGPEAAMKLVNHFEQVDSNPPTTSTPPLAREALDEDVETPLQAPSSPYNYLVMEALELVAAPNKREGLVLAALERADLTAIPSERTAFSQFVTGPLAEVLQERLGEEAADAVVQDLQSTSGIHQRPVIPDDLDVAIAPPVGDLFDDLDPLEAPLELETTHDGESGVRHGSIKVVLADDDERLLAVLERMLVTEGFTVLTATNGRDALSICLRDEPDVLVADMHMPVLNGRDVAQLLKRMRDDLAPATVLLTADPTVPRQLPNVAAVLGKPIRSHELISAIERANERAAEGAAGTPRGGRRRKRQPRS